MHTFAKVAIHALAMVAICIVSIVYTGAISITSLYIARELMHIPLTSTQLVKCGVILAVIDVTISICFRYFAERIERSMKASTENGSAVQVVKMNEEIKWTSPIACGK